MMESRKLSQVNPNFVNPLEPTPRYYVSIRPPPPPRRNTSRGVFGYSFETSRYVGLSVLAITFVVIFYLFTKMGWGTRGPRRRRNAATGGGQAASGEGNGLQQEEIEILGRIVKYEAEGTRVSPGDGTGGGGEMETGGGGEAEQDRECIVCLGDYKPGEVLRRLNYCGHSFHRECIDAWLKSKSTCPLCRVPLRQDEQKIGSQDTSASVVAAASDGIVIVPNSSQPIPTQTTASTSGSSLGALSHSSNGPRFHS